VRKDTTLTVETIRTATSGVYFSNDALTYQVVILFLSLITIDFLHYAYKFMSWHSLKAHIALDNLQVGVADTGQQDTDQGFAFHKGRVRILRFKR
jgi:hypothetical protein